MARCHFSVSDTNPNDRAGGSGCLCSPTHLPDAAGPFLIFHGVETDNAFSPYAVVCADCAYEGACKAGVVPDPEPPAEPPADPGSFFVPPPAPATVALPTDAHKYAMIAEQQKQIKRLRDDITKLNKQKAARS